MNLPEETLELAREKAEELGEAPAEQLYELTDEIDYGFRDALKSGDYFRYPHELDGKATCHEKAVFTYAVAKEAGLNPRFLKRESSGGDIHPFVDVETEEGRKIIDSHNYMFGEVEYYSDHERKLKNEDSDYTTSEKYERIEELSEDHFISELKNLRRNPVAMIARTQSLRETGYDGDYKDRIKFDRDERALIRTISSSDNIGFLNDSVSIKWFFDTEGNVKEQKTLFNAIEGSGWNKLHGKELIAEKTEEGYRKPEELSEKLKEDVKTLALYSRQKEGEFLHEKDGLEEVLDRIKDSASEVIEGNTGFRGRDVRRWIKSMENVRENSSEHFMSYADWLKFLENRNEDEEPEPEDVIPERVEGHEELLDKALGGEADESVGAAKQEIECILEGENVSAEEQVEKIEQKGISRAYKELANSLREMLENGFSQESLQKLQELGPLTVVEPEVRQRMGVVLEKVAESSNEEQQEFLEQYIEETEKTFENEGNTDRPWKATVKWGYDPENHEIRHVVEAKNGFSDYTTKMEVGYGFDGDNRIKIEETTEGTEDGFTFVDRSFEELDELMNSSISAEAWRRAPDITSKNNLRAPEPSRDEDFFTKNIGAVLFYAANDWRGEPQFFDEETLEEFAEQAKKEDEWLVESPFFMKQRRKSVKKEIETTWKREEDRANVLEQNKIIGLMNKGNREKLLEIADEHYDDKREMAADYSQKHLNMIDEHLNRDEIKQKKEVLKQSVMKGLKMSRPDTEDVERFAEETGFENIAEAAKNVEAGISQEEVDALEEDLDRISDRNEKQGLVESLQHLARNAEDEETEKRLQELQRRAKKVTPEQDLREALKQKGIELKN